MLSKRTQGVGQPILNGLTVVRDVDDRDAIGGRRLACLAETVDEARHAELWPRFVEAYAEELNIWPLVLLTGGDAKLLCPDVQEDGIVQAVVEDLTLRGVAMAYYNSLLE